MSDKKILQCGGADELMSVKAACFYLDPDQGKWVKSDYTMMGGRKQSSSSLYGEGRDILITGGRDGQDNPQSSTELLKNGR